jgi:hypothetical protein
MQSPFNRLVTLLLLSLSIVASLSAQDLNLEQDIRGRPFQANVVAMPAEGIESVPWEFEKVFNAIVNNAFRKTPGVGKVFTPQSLARLKYGAKSTPWMRTYLESSHFMVQTYVEGGVIIKNSNGNEILRFLSFQLSITNIATSQVEKTIRIQCDSKRFFERAKKKKASKYPGLKLYQWALQEHASELLKKELKRFFYNVEPVEDWSLDGKDKGFFTKFRGSKNKDLQKLVDVVAIQNTITSPWGPLYQFVHLGTAKYFPSKAQRGKPYYRFISGRSRAEKALKLGMKVYIYPDDSLL